MLTPISEIVVHFLSWPTLFALASYGSFLVSVPTMPMGLSALAERKLPWRPGACTYAVKADGRNRVSPTMKPCLVGLLAIAR
jgi:hypothetical protein